MTDIFAIVKVALPLAMLLGIMALRGMLTCWQRARVKPRLSSSRVEARADRLQLIETIVFHLQLVTSWRSIVELIRGMDGGVDSLTRSLAQSGGVVAILLLAIQALTLVRYGVATWEVCVTEQQKRRRWSSNLSLDRLRYRLSYHTKRFSGHAQ